MAFGLTDTIEAHRESFTTRALVLPLQADFERRRQVFLVGCVLYSTGHYKTFFAATGIVMKGKILMYDQRDQMARLFIKSFGHLQIKKFAQ